MAVLWAKLIRHVSFWGLDYPLGIVATFILAAPIVRFLPRELVPNRHASSGALATLDLNAPDIPDSDTRQS